MDSFSPHNSEKHNSQPLRMLVFAGSPVCISSLNMLYQQQQLAGVVLPEQVSQFSQHLQDWLQQAGMAHLQFNQHNSEQLTEWLTGCESDLAINFAFDPCLLESYAHIPAYGLFHCHFSAYPAYQGPMPLYWQVRDSCKQTYISLQKAGVTITAPALQRDIAVKQAIDIHPADTLQSLEHKVSAQILPLLHQFVQRLEQQQGNIELDVAEGEVSLAPQIQEADLKVNWAEMGSEQICALARAGNPHFGGCIVVLGNTELSLLQASVVDYATYGVPAGTICHSGEPEGVIVATTDGAVRLDILSNADGVFSAVAFCERFLIGAGMAFAN